MAQIWTRLAGRTRTLLRDGLRALSPPLDAAFAEELEELLLAADFGPHLAAALRAGVMKRAPRTRQEASQALAAELLAQMAPGERRLNLAAGVSCILLYGVNGAGKTTSAAKLARLLKVQGRRPLLVAADTFRAAGIDQLRVLGDKIGVDVLASQSGGDPAALVFDALNMAATRGYDVVVVDTAGRAHTQKNLLGELAKIGRVAARALEGAPHEALLVLDAHTGLTTLPQAKAFDEALKITGFVVTKLDGSARGGSLVVIESSLKVPTKLVGVGEGMDDLVVFDPLAYAQGMLAE